MELKNNIWTEEEINILNQHYKIQSVEFLQRLLPGRTANSIKIKSNRIGLVKDYWWSEYEKEFLKLNYIKYGQAYCSKSLGRSIKSINKQVNTLELGGHRTTGFNCRIKHVSSYKVDAEKFINIITPEVSYILGLLYADGNINGGQTISITSLKNDIDEIKWIFDSTGIWNYTTFQKTDKGWREMAILETSNPILYQFLFNNDYAIKSGASADKIIDKIPLELQHYFFLGFSDGDGCFYFKKCNSKKCLRQFTIVGPFNQNWKFIIKLLDNLNIKYSYRQNSRVNENGNLSQNSSIRVCNKNGIIKFGNYIYKDIELNHIGFNRKYDKFLDIKKSYLI